MGWDFEDMGSFDDEAAAENWADRQGLDPRDVQSRREGSGVKVSVRRSALGSGGSAPSDNSFGRRSGW